VIEVECRRNYSLLNMLMPKIRKRSSPWLFLAGIALAEVGVVLVGYGSWDALNIRTSVGGFLLCMVGMCLVWKEPLTAMIVQDEAAPDEAKVKCHETFLGRINLNGYYFEAYEEETSHCVRRFRLRSFPPINAEREAGFIRYLIREGFIERRWPRLSRKFEGEADWAFFL
jgi:hypothetical protein